MNIIDKLTTNLSNDVVSKGLRTAEYTPAGGNKVFIKNKNDFETFFSTIRADGTLTNIAKMYSR